MKKLLALILAAIMIMAFFTGCGQPAQEAAPAEGAPAAESAPAAEKAEGAPARDSVNISINAALGSIDPHRTSVIGDRVVLWQVYNGLMFFDELNGVAECDLAESYEISEDGLVYTFKIRDDAYFHNGDKVKASDVVFSFDRACDPETSAVTSYTAAYDHAEVIDDSTVAIHLSQPYSPFIINSSYIFIISEREVIEQGDKFGSIANTAGAGAYKIDSLDNDVMIGLVANENYYKGVAPIKYVNIYPITDSASGLISFEAGDLDWYTPSVLDALRIESEGSANVEFMNANHISFTLVNPNGKVEPLHDERVRQAIAYAINKDELNMAAFEGYAGVADYMIDPATNFCAPEGDVVFDYNPELAKELLAEAGYADGVDCGTLLCFQGNYFETLATVVQAQLEAVGINVQLEWVELKTLLDRTKTGDYDVVVFGVSLTGDYAFSRRFYHMGEGYIEFGDTEYDVVWMDEMMDKASACSDPAERLAINKELDEYFANTATHLPLLYKAVPAVWAKDLNVINRPINPIIYDWSWN